MKKEGSQSMSDAPLKPPPKVPDADLEYEETGHDDDDTQQSGASDPSVPADSQ